MTEQQKTPTPKSTPRQRRTIALLLIAFIGPLVLAAWLYTGGRDWITHKSTVHGHLILPPMALSAWQIQPAPTQKKGLPPHQWLFIYFQPGTCALQCQENLFKARQVHRALGKDYARVQRVFLTYPQTSADPLWREAHKRYPELWLGLTQSSDVHQAVQGSPVTTSELHAGAFLLADPNGNVMMRYARDVTFRDILLDLRRLLKVSRIG